MTGPHNRLKTPKPSPETLPETRDPDELKTRGFVIDDTVYPHFAYKGPRFAPTESQWCWTVLETKLERAIEAAIDQVDFSGFDDRTKDQIEEALSSSNISINYQKGFHS